jgi:hypothetical protein
MTRRSLTYKGYNYVLFLELCHSSSPALEQVEQRNNADNFAFLFVEHRASMEA